MISVDTDQEGLAPVHASLGLYLPTSAKVSALHQRGGAENTACCQTATQFTTDYALWPLF